MSCKDPTNHLHIISRGGTAHPREGRRWETFYPNIIGCHVTVELPHSTTIRVSSTTRIDIKVPGSDRENRDKHEDIHVALRDA
ncbi:MAG: hypothetical protein M5R42_01975 [Rhodocyclaceae bacterium]|nr:hypothetical protein [Rhodocyclaceae bacterium]